MSASQQKTVLVVGGSGGVGSATISLFVQKRWKIYATYYRSAEEIKVSSPDHVVWLEADVRSDEQLSSVFKRIEADGRCIDLLVNTVASGLILKNFSELTLEDFSREIDIYLLGSVRILKYAEQYMNRESGVVIQLLTDAVSTIPPRMSSYVTAKYGVLGLVKCVAQELKRKGILLFGLSPTFVETEMLKAFPSKLLEFERAKTPTGSFLLSADVAKKIFNVFENKDLYSPGENICFEKSE